MVIAAPADGLALNSARPSAGTVMTELDKFMWLVIMILFTFMDMVMWFKTADDISWYIAEFAELRCCDGWGPDQGCYLFTKKLCKKYVSSGIVDHKRD